MTLNRREFVQLAAAIGATFAAAAPARASRTKWTERRDLYPQGVASGDPDPASVILEEAAKNACDVIVMATHGRSGFSRLVFGSVADQVLRGSPTPVLLVRVAETKSAPGSATS